MDSLLANYASSDDDDERELSQQQEENQPKIEIHNSLSSSILSSIPPPKSAACFSSRVLSLPPPKSSSFRSSSQTVTNPADLEQHEGDDEDEGIEEHNRHGKHWKVGDSKVTSDHNKQPNSATKSSASAKPLSSFSSLPLPKFSSISSSLPQPKSSSIFSSLPPPKAQIDDPVAASYPSSTSDPQRKKVVLFRPPINPYAVNPSKADEDDDIDDEEKEKQSKKSNSSGQTSSVKSFLSSMLPPPKHSVSLGSFPTASGTGRRSIIEAEAPVSTFNNPETERGISAYSKVSSQEDQWATQSSSTSLAAVGVPSDYADGSGDPSSYNSVNESSDSYGAGAVGDPSYWGYTNENTANYAAYGAYGDSAHYQSQWVDGAATSATPGMLGAAESLVFVPGKRGRNDIPNEIIEVKQDDLMKNRPREDQVKLTGIAFGPSYQPVSTKGKPSKLHKRKHQIGSLFFDMKQKEGELSERRARGFLTKAETQAKYGW